MDLERSSFIDQIITQTIALLSDQEEFEDADLKRLEQLLRSGESSIAESVVCALCTREESPA